MEKKVIELKKTRGLKLKVPIFLVLKNNKKLVFFFVKIIDKLH